MHRPGHLFVAQHVDRALDLPPAAEVDDIPQAPAAVGALGGLRAGIFAEPVDQLRRLGESRAVLDMDVVTQPNPRSFFSLSEARA